MSDSNRLAAFRRMTRKRMQEIDEELAGTYGEEIAALSGLSRDEIDRIAPGNTTDIDTYMKLIAVVKEASRRNIAAAEVRQQINKLGQTALDILKLVPGVAQKFGFPLGG